MAWKIFESKIPDGHRLYSIVYTVLCGIGYAEFGPNGEDASHFNFIETYNRLRIETVGAERKSKRIQKEMKKLTEKYPSIGNNEFFISRWGYTLEFSDNK